MLPTLSFRSALLGDHLEKLVRVRSAAHKIHLAVLIVCDWTKRLQHLLDRDCSLVISFHDWVDLLLLAILHVKHVLVDRTIHSVSRKLCLSLLANTINSAEGLLFYTVIPPRIL